MKENEIEILKEVSEDNNVDLDMLMELIKIEKEYANLNMSRRSGIFQRLNFVLEPYIDKERS